MMRYLVMLAAAALALASPLEATELGGNIIEDTTWTAAGNPWVITQNTLVKFEATLTIEAGSVVEFDGDYYLRTDSTSGGHIVVEGAAGDSVRFAAAGGGTQDNQWKGIGVYASSGSSFEYCVIRNARTGLELSGSDAPVTHCAIRQCQTGLTVRGASPAIESTWINENTLVGIICDGNPTHSQPDITDCNIFDNGTWNLYLMNYAGPTVTSIDARWNWWGTQEGETIGSLIRDRFDEAGVYGEVNYNPWLSEVPVEPVTWGRLKELFME